MSQLGAYIRSNLPEDKYPGESGDEVVNHFREGECTFDQVLLRYNPMIISRAIRPIFGMDRDDVYQEMLINLHKCCFRWKPDSDATFSTYLYTSLTNKFKHLLRRQSSETCLANCVACSLDEDRDDDEGGSTPKYEVSVAFEVSLEFEIDDLPLDEREKFILINLIKGYSQADIGRTLGLTRARVNQLLGDLTKKLHIID